MSKKMLSFVTTSKETPSKRDADMRIADFGEIYDEFDKDVAETQASRCSQCGVPFCQINCPLHNNIPDWLMLTAEGRMEEAYKLSAQTNNMPEICGRICPQDRLCEGSCVIEKGFASVTIGAVEKQVDCSPMVFQASSWKSMWLSAGTSCWQMAVLPFS